jgi:hypothetical protein
MRRCEEAQEIEKTMLANEWTPLVTRAVREVTCELADVAWAERDDSPWSMEEVLEAFHNYTLQDSPKSYAEAVRDAGDQAGGNCAGG